LNFGISIEVWYKNPPPSAIPNPLAATLKDDTTDNKQTEKDRQNANASQNKKSCNQPHKPTQIAAHFILPNRTQAHPPP